MIIFCEADASLVKNLKLILRCFELMLGLKINFLKNQLSGVGVQNQPLKEFADLLKCRVQALPLHYLGMPLGVSPRLKSSWKPVTDKFRRKLASWKMRFLSFGGGLVLNKSGLISFPFYYMSIFKIPSGVAKD